MAPAAKPGPCLLDGRRGVTDRRGDAAVAQPADELDRHRAARGRSVISRRPSSERLERRAGRRPGTRSCRVMRAASGRGEERAFEVEPERLGAVGRGVGQPGPDPLGEPGELVERRGHGGRQERGHAAAEQPAGHPVERRADRPSRRGRPSRGRGRRRSPGRCTGRRRRRRRSSSSTATIRPSSRVIRPGATRSSRTSRPRRSCRGVIGSRRPPVGRVRARHPAPRRRTGRRARSGRPGSAIRWPRHGDRGRRR